MLGLNSFRHLITKIFIKPSSSKSKTHVYSINLEYEKGDPNNFERLF